MNPFKTILGFACGEPLPAEDDGRARRAQLAIGGIFGAVVLSMLWGLAAGSSQHALLIANAYKVPIIVLVSATCALPAGLLAWRFSGAPGRASDLLLAFVSGVFSATLVLAVLSPLVALYYHSSAWAGPILGQGSVIAGAAVGCFVFARNVLKRAGELKRRRLALVAATFPLLLLATMLQMIALFRPILPDRTVFDRGIDEVAGPIAPARAPAATPAQEP